VRRVLKALANADYLPDTLVDWYGEDARSYGRGGFHYEDPMICDLMVATEGLGVSWLSELASQD